MNIGGLCFRVALLLSAVCSVALARVHPRFPVDTVANGAIMIREKTAR